MNRFNKGVEINNQKINVTDVIVLHGLNVAFIIALGQNAAMDFGVQRFNAAIHDFGKTGMVRYVFNLNTGLFHGLGGAPGGENFNAVALQFFGKFNNACFIGYGNQSPFNLDRTRITNDMFTHFI